MSRYYPSLRQTTGKLWFTQTLTYDGSRNRVGYIAQDGRVTLYRFPRKDAFVWAIASDANGGAWVSEFGAHRVAHVSGSGKITEFALLGSDSELVRSIAVEPNGSVWALLGDAIVHLSTTGSGNVSSSSFPNRSTALHENGWSGRRLLLDDGVQDVGS